MTTINEIPDDVLETHILPLATEEEKLRERITDLEQQKMVLEVNCDELEKSITKLKSIMSNNEERDRKNEKRIKYYKGQVDYLVSASLNYSYGDDY